MPLLAIYFIIRTKLFPPGLKKWITGALLFSWFGDLLLMFVENNSAFFLAGLSSFLMAHICYIFFYHYVRIREKVKGKIVLLLPVLVYYIILMTTLSPGLGEMKLPVWVYGIVICFMLVLAIHMLYIPDKAAGLLMMCGALLFVLSDSILAINKFYSPLRAAGFMVMITYGLAQILIVQGAIGYLSGHKKAAG